MTQTNGHLWTASTPTWAGLYFTFASQPPRWRCDRYKPNTIPRSEQLHFSSPIFFPSHLGQNGITKGLACVQVSWLLAQRARAIQHLPLTTLELTRSTVIYMIIT